MHKLKSLIGLLMKFCHIKLESNLPERNYDKILEIGPGPHPHIKYISHSYKKYYILESTTKAAKHYKKLKYGSINAPPKWKFDVTFFSC